MGFGSSAQLDVISFGSNPANVRNGEKQNAPPRLEDNAIGVKVSRPLAAVQLGRALFLCAKLLARPLDGRFQPLVAKWLQQIIYGINVERSHRVLVVCGSKNHARRRNFLLTRQGSNDIKPIHSRHANIEEQQLRSGGANQFNRFESTRGFADNFNVSFFTEQLPYFLPG